MKPGDWISLAGVVVAFGSAVWAVVSARRAARAQERAEHYQARAEQNAERATQAAEAAAAAQRQSADAAQRAADALERQNEVADELQDAAEGVPWRIAYRQGALWELINNSDFPKFNVQISGPGVVAHRTAKLFERIDGQSSEVFWGATHMGSQPRVEVTWHRREDGDDEPRTWAGTMPPKS